MPKITINPLKIKALCASKKISLNDLFLACDISRQNWYYHLKNSTLPLDVLQKICYHLNCKPNDIFDLEYEIVDNFDFVNEKEVNYNPKFIDDIIENANSIIEKAELLKVGRK